MFSWHAWFSSDFDPWEVSADVEEYKVSGGILGVVVNCRPSLLAEFIME